MKLTPKWSHLVLLAVTFASALAGRTDAASQKACTEDEEKHALDQADRLKDWNDVYRAFKRYGHCDDGAIAEGYRDTIGRLLAHDWEHVDDMFRLTATDITFKRFVLRHTDETIPADELKTIANNAKLHCPSGQDPFCGQIVAHAVPSSPSAQSKLPATNQNAKARIPNGPNCSGSWPTNMTFVLLKNAGITNNEKVDFSKTKTVRVASEKIGKDLYHQVYYVALTEYSGRTIEAIAVHDASSEECSMTGVELFVVSQHLDSK